MSKLAIPHKKPTIWKIFPELYSEEQKVSLISQKTAFFILERALPSQFHLIQIFKQMFAMYSGHFFIRRVTSNSILSTTSILFHIYQSIPISSTRIYHIYQIITGKFYHMSWKLEKLGAFGHARAQIILNW